MCLGGSLTGAGTLDATANAKRWSLWLAAAPPVVSRENRLIWVVPASPSNDPPRNKKVKFVYDYMGRRVQKAVYTYNDGWPGTPGEVQRFVYDGWNVVMVLNDDNETLGTLTWGLDLSGSIHGAGGIGGLLSAVEVHDPESSTDDERFWYFYDANGNVGQILTVEGTNPAYIYRVAHYEYDPFGNTIVIDDRYCDTSGNPVGGTCPFGRANPIRFSTKWFDAETGLGYWGYRYYSPRLGRWISRDPIGEEGGLNLCGFVKNSPIDRWDFFGLSGLEAWCKLRGVALRQAWGLSIAGNDVMGIGVAGAITPMFFPDTCEVALFGVYTSAFNGPPPSVAAGSVWQKIIWMAQSFNFGANMGVSFSGEYAVYLGAGVASAASYAGNFYGAAGGGGPISGQVFWGGGWYGGNLGIGVTFPPVSFNLQPEYYAIIAGPLVLPNCLCYAAITLH